LPFLSAPAHLTFPLQKVLIPGSGLGRLVFDIVCDGYAAQGNEFSYQMIFVSNFILNCNMGVEQMAICPFIDTPCNHAGAGDMTREVRVPDVSIIDAIEECSKLLPPGERPDMSMVSGEWLQIYKDQSDTWDAVVTCFFIDTAPIVMEYIDAIYRLLRPGGVWINLGPLLYHWASSYSSGHEDPRYQQSIELSCDEIKEIAESYGFTVESLSQHVCNYTCNQRSMMQTTYHSALFVARKPTA
jgi:carnosine N-methyltransferase